MHTPADLQSYLDIHAPGATLIANLGDTPTVPAAAAALGVETDQIIKTLLFTLERPDGVEETVVVISNGERRIDKRLLAEACGVTRKRVTLASAERVAELIDYPVGGVPPFGHSTVLPALLDESVLRAAERFGGVLYGGGGDDRTMMRLRIEDLLRLCEPRVAALSGR